MKTKQFKVPVNTKVQITQEDNRVVIEFVPKKVEFKDGCFLFCLGSPKNGIFIYNDKGKNILTFYVDLDGLPKFNDEYWGYKNDKDVRFATDSERQQLINTLAKQGLKWNAEEKKVEKIKWRAKIGDTYYFVADTCERCMGTDDSRYLDNKRYLCGNYFKTEGHAEAAAKLVRETLLKFQGTL